MKSLQQIINEGSIAKIDKIINTGDEDNDIDVDVVLDYNDTDEDETDFDDDGEYEIDVEIISDESEELEESGRFLRTTKIKNSSKVVKQVTQDLYGPDGSAKGLVTKLFKTFKIALKKKSQEMGVPIGDVKSYVITLRDYNHPDVGKTLSGKKK